MRSTKLHQKTSLKLRSKQKETNLFCFYNPPDHEKDFPRSSKEFPSSKYVVMSVIRISVYYQTNKPGTAQIGAISMARK